MFFVIVTRKENVEKIHRKVNINKFTHGYVCLEKQPNTISEHIDNWLLDFWKIRHKTLDLNIFTEATR